MLFYKCSQNHLHRPAFDGLLASPALTIRLDRSSALDLLLGSLIDIPLLDTAEAFFRGDPFPATLVRFWPTPQL